LSTKKDPHAEALDQIVAGGQKRLEALSQRIQTEATWNRDEAAKIVSETRGTLEQLRDLIEKAPRLIPEASDAGLFVGQFTVPWDGIDLSRQDLCVEIYGHRVRLSGAILRDPRLRLGDNLAAVLLLQKIPTPEAK
jgi:hypothetical protein